MALDKNGIARRIAQELRNGWYVNLGIGIPTLVANYIPDGIDVEFQSEGTTCSIFSSKTCFLGGFNMRVSLIQSGKLGCR